MSAICARCTKGRNHLDHSRGLCEYLAAKAKPKEAKQLAPRSPKMSTFYREERLPLNEAVMARDGYQCIVLSPWHERLADYNPLTVHEIATRGREGGIRAPGVNTMENCVSACLRCNQAISENPEWALEHGWLRPASPLLSIEGEAK